MHRVRLARQRMGAVLFSLMLANLMLVSATARAATAVDKSETVHVRTDAAGTVSTITVEELLANDAQAPTLDDRTNLSNIVATDENQSFVANPDGTITWTTRGKHVSYEGTASGQLPVTVTLSYTLDGTPVSPSELAGATGHLVMRIDYVNNSSHTRQVGSTQRKVSTPFVCMSAIMLDSEVFTHVVVENGKVIDDKGGLAVVGYATPGLRESLDLSEEDIDIELPEHVQIEADVTDFMLDPVYTIVTPELFADLDVDDLDLGFDDLDGGADALGEAMTQLIEGSDSLTDALTQITAGTSTIDGSVSEFKDKISALPSGMQALSGGASDLAEGLAQARSTASLLATVAEGLAGTSAANTGIEAAKEAVGSADEAVSSLSNAANALLADTKSTAASAADAATTVRDELSAAKESVEGDLDAANEALTVLQGIDTTGWTDEQRAALAGLGQALTSAGTNLDSVFIDQTSIDVLANAVTTLEDIDGKTVGQAAQEAHDKLSEATASLDASAVTITEVTGISEQLRNGIVALSTGLTGAADAAESLAHGLAGISSTAPQVVEGVTTLGEGIGQLNDALTATSQGSGMLTEGLSAFNDEGITKVVDALNELDADLGDISNRLNVLRDAANEYDSFAGKLDGQTGSVRFIYKTEQIG